MKIFVTLFITIFSIQLTLAQETIDLRIVNDDVNLGTMKFTFDVECQRSSSGWDKLGTSNFPFYYDSSGIHNPILLQAYNFNVLEFPIFYNPMTITDNDNWVSINIDLVAPNFGQDVSTSWMGVAQIQFDIKNQSKTSGLIWRTDGAWAAFDDDQSTPVNPGTLSGKDVSLPVTLTSFTASQLENKVVLEWITESEVENLGFEILRAFNKQDDYQILASYKDNHDLQGQLNSSTAHKYTYTDFEVVAGQTYWYKLVSIDIAGTREEAGTLSVELLSNGLESISYLIPDKFALYQNYPNPFNPETHIRVDIPYLKNGPEQAKLTIYNSLGQLVRKLYSGNISPGSFEITWYGDSDNGRTLPSGVYFYRFESKSFTDIHKMVYLK